MADDQKKSGKKQRTDYDPEPVYMDTPEAEEEININLDFQDPKKTSEPEKLWYVVHCYSGYEYKVCHAIEQRIETMGMRDKIFDVIVPTQEEIEVKEGK